MQRCCAVHTAATSYRRLAANGIKNVNTAEQLATLFMQYLLRQECSQMTSHSLMKGFVIADPTKSTLALLDTLQPGSLGLHLLCT